MKRLSLLLVLLLFVTIGFVQAQQNVPEPVRRAFEDYNQRHGTSVTPAGINWRWSEELFESRALGCDHLEASFPEPELITGYSSHLNIFRNRPVGLPHE